MNKVSTRGSVLYQALVWLCSLNLVSSKLMLVTVIDYCTAVGKGFTDYYSLYCYPGKVYKIRNTPLCIAWDYSIHCDHFSC